ncbi:hypothetical protein N7463_001221 [Penicillium fimorum]|uniref:Uncharacterized protein n=1 Tax=Penicillium fimorum TaxID=1882269 RepID=A0A9X0CCP2_9EURO|nr:hypothetical protein N7463_001221 [Penicillium fimorum]
MLSNLHLKTLPTTKDSNSFFALGAIIDPELFHKLPRTILREFCTHHDDKQCPNKTANEASMASSKYMIILAGGKPQR